MFIIEGKTAFITGGTSGIGLAVAKRFVKAGAKVAIAGRRSEGEAIAEKIEALFIRCDVSDEEQVVDALSMAEQKLGKLDVIINNAGILDIGPTIEEHDTAALEQNIGVLQKGVYFGLRHAPRHMNDGGSIINTSSIAGLMGLYGYGQYAMTKAAIISLTQTAAVELAPRAIRVNAVCPGPVKTAMATDGDPQTPLIEALTPLGHIASTEEIEGLYHFLAADESRYITGQVIVIDGGLTHSLSLAIMQMEQVESERNISS